MKPMYVFDKLNGDKKEVAVINYVEQHALLWTNSSGNVRATTERWFHQIEALESESRETD